MDVTEAYERIETQSVVVPVRRGLVRLSGPQRVWFLQNTVTNDVEDVPSGRWVASCFLDRKGKVLAHFRVGVADEDVWLDVDPPATAELVEWMVRFRFRTQVEIEDRSTTGGVVVGPAARDLAGPGEVRPSAAGIVFGDELAGRSIAVVHGRPPAGLPVAPDELLDVLRLEGGVGRFGVDYGPQTLPQEAGLTHLLSVTKGCYVGQEVVARLHFRGHVNKVLRTLQLDAAVDPVALPGAEVVLDAAQIGVVTSAARSPGRGTIALAMVRVEPEAGARVSVLDTEAVLGPVPEGTKVKS